MINNQEGDITKRYCQMIITRPDWTTNHLTDRTRSLPSCERPDKIVGTGPVTTPLNTNCGEDDTGTAEEHIHRTKEGENHIFEWKDLGGKLPSDSPTRIDASMRLQTPDKDSNEDSTSKGINPLNSSTISEDSDEVHHYPNGCCVTFQHKFRE